ncbi:hypothetical protein C4D60_Mb04t34820 [Musa balbisiana]|uniref:Uncharacterized protein n=1 Tax=Musa balbisiana TaxID=52838 RepID=A0A4S8KGT9_MUSBA|nr:hypothetical protein C4D60_Mb04t34820 [Musa balbisiana]
MRRARQTTNLAAALNPTKIINTQPEIVMLHQQAESKSYGLNLEESGMTKRHINLLRVRRQTLTTQKGQLRVLQQHGDEHQYQVSKHSITAEAEESLKNSWSHHEACQRSIISLRLLSSVLINPTQSKTPNSFDAIKALEIALSAPNGRRPPEHPVAFRFTFLPDYVTKNSLS